GVSRAGLLAGLESVVVKAQKKAREKESGQMSLLAMMPEDSQSSCPGIGFDCPEQGMPEWEHDTFSRCEKEALGFFFTSHPLQPFRREMLRQNLTPLEECRELPPGSSFKCAVLANAGKLRFDRKNRRWALLDVEDLTASGTAFCFSDAYELYKDLLQPDVPLYMEGKISRPRDEDPAEAPEGEDAPPKEVKFIVEKVMLLSDACAASAQPVCIEMEADKGLEGRLDCLKEVLQKHKGQTCVHVLLNLGDSWCRMELSASYSVMPGPELDQDIGVWAKG
ncbi:DNA polymerase III subunit alpha, partial [Desulfovibrio sp. OttesenSCG-928-A18]|nr:DNA polymerase III subunit alpha [Desulfovibrio sp. OttesenSCG-928-A18]